MKKILVLFCTLCICVIGIAVAETININWYVDGSVYDTSTCTVGGDLILPAPPTKRGYTFLGWARYIPIEYITSTGTQWIDTGIIPNKNTRFFVDFMTYNDLCTCTSYGAIFGGTWATYVLSTWTSSSGGYFGSNSSNKAALEIKKNVRGQISFIGNKFTSFSGTVSIITLSDFNTSESLRVFSESSGKGNFKGRLYSLQLFDNDTLIRDFIPVLDPQGVACLLDKVSQTFFYNAGTGDFIAGPIITE